MPGTEPVLTALGVRRQDRAVSTQRCEARHQSSVCPVPPELSQRGKEGEGEEPRSHEGRWLSRRGALTSPPAVPSTSQGTDLSLGPGTPRPLMRKPGWAVVQDQATEMRVPVRLREARGKPKNPQNSPLLDHKHLLQPGELPSLGRGELQAVV